MKPAQIYRLAWAFYLVLAIGAVVWMGWRGGRIPADLFFDRSAWAEDLALGVAAGLLLVGVWQALRRYLDRARELERRISELLGGLEPAEALALAVISGFAEELFFRGAMQTAWGWPIATGVFVLLHSGPGAVYRVWTLFAALAGVLLAGLMLWRGSLLAPVTAHVVVNAVNLMRLAARGGGEGSEAAE